MKRIIILILLSVCCLSAVFANDLNATFSANGLTADGTEFEGYLKTTIKIDELRSVFLTGDRDEIVNTIYSSIIPVQAIFGKTADEHNLILEKISVKYTGENGDLIKVPVQTLIDIDLKDRKAGIFRITYVLAFISQDVIDAARESGESLNMVDYAEITLECQVQDPLLVIEN